MQQQQMKYDTNVLFKDSGNWKESISPIVKQFPECRHSRLQQWYIF